MSERLEIWLERSRPVDDETEARSLIKAWAGRLLDLGTWWVLQDGPSKRLDRVAPEVLGGPSRKAKNKDVWRVRLARSAGGVATASLLLKIGGDAGSGASVTARVSSLDPSMATPELLVAIARDLGAERGTWSRPSPTPPRAGVLTLVRQRPASVPDGIRVIELGGSLSLVTPAETEPSDVSIQRVAHWLDGEAEPVAPTPPPRVERAIASFMHAPAPLPIEITSQAGDAVDTTDLTQEMPALQVLQQLIRDADPRVAIPRAPRVARAATPATAPTVTDGPESETVEMLSPHELRESAKRPLPFGDAGASFELPMPLDAYAAARALLQAYGADDEGVRRRYGVDTHRQMLVIDHRMNEAFDRSPQLRKLFVERYQHFLSFIPTDERKR